MCNFFSYVGFADGTIKFSTRGDSHSQIIAEQGLSDTKGRKWARFEISPKSGHDFTNVTMADFNSADKWISGCDEGGAYFSWLTPALTAQFKALAVAEIKKMFVNSKVACLSNGRYFLGPKANVALITHCNISRISTGAKVGTITQSTVGTIEKAAIRNITGGTRVNYVVGASIRYLESNSIVENADKGTTIDYMTNNASIDDLRGTVKQMSDSARITICNGKVLKDYSENGVSSTKAKEIETAMDQLNELQDLVCDLESKISKVFDKLEALTI